MIGLVQGSFVLFCTLWFFLCSLCRSVQIAPSFQHRGLGKKLVEVSKSIGKCCACQSSIAMVWKVRLARRVDGQGDEIANSFLLKVGFKAVEEKSMRLLNDKYHFLQFEFSSFFVCWIVVERLWIIITSRMLIIIQSPTKFILCLICNWVERVKRL